MRRFFVLLFLSLFFINNDTHAKEQNHIDQKFLTDGADKMVFFFQKPTSSVMHEIIKTHNIIFIAMSLIFVLCCAFLLFIIFRFSEKNNPKPQKFTHNTTLEIVWTVIPIFIVCIFSFFNLRTLHHEEIQKDSDLTIKIVGHQWYWTYEYPDSQIKFDSYMIKDEDLKDGDKRLLSVDNPVYVPKGKNIKLLITADDVIHSWAIPSFGVKKDAVPGRVNETWFRADEEGVFYGQCSELCGILHGFMPIEVRVVSDEEFSNWQNQSKTKFAA
jgi:cytochrome c oxidase subunit 2